MVQDVVIEAPPAFDQNNIHSVLDEPIEIEPIEEKSAQSTLTIPDDAIYAPIHQVIPSKNRIKFLKKLKKVDSATFDQIDISFDEKQAESRAILQISCKDTLFTLTTTHDVYFLERQNNNSSLVWKKFNTHGKKLCNISAASADILYGVGYDDHLLYRFNTQTTSMRLVIPNDTQKIKQVAAASPRQIYAISEDNTVLSLRLTFFKKTGKWKRFGSHMKKISVGGKSLFKGNEELWGIEDSNQPCRWIGDRWLSYPVQVRDISVSHDNCVYAIRESDGKLIKFDGKSFIPQGVGANTNVELTNVCAYLETTHVYAVERSTGNLLRMSY